ncbi:MAG: LCP family protein [Oscillospiraceae bacterium]|nr:LCP family protein [Oscillospiraceae bacterium]
MVDSDFRDDEPKRMEHGRVDDRQNMDEAWDQVKAFFGNPVYWIVFCVVVLLFIAGIFTAKFLWEIRAPDIPQNSSTGPVTIGEEPVEIIGDEPWDEIHEIDDSNTEQPVVSGERKEGWYTFLLFGMDKFSGSTDTIMVVAYNVKDQNLNLMSIPRDTMVNVSWDLKKINSVYSMSGINGLKKHIGKLIGFVPDYYVKIDLKAFVEVVDLIGGVEYDVPRVMDYDDDAQDLHIHLKPGLQKLNGEQAMGLVRWRKNNTLTSGYDDTGRVKTQQSFLKEMFKQCLKLKNWTKISGYVEIFNKDVESDLSLGNMLWFARQAMELSEGDFFTCTIPGNYYAYAWSRSTQSMQSYVTLYRSEVKELVNDSFNPYLSKVTDANLDIMSILQDGSVTSSTGYVADGIAALPPDIPDPEDEEEDGDGEEGEEGEEGGEDGEDGKNAEDGDRKDTENGNGETDSENGTDETPPTTGDAETNTGNETGSSGNDNNNDNTTPSGQEGNE